MNGWHMDDECDIRDNADSHSTIQYSFWFLPDCLHASWTCTELSGHCRFCVL